MHGSNNAQSYAKCASTGKVLGQAQSLRKPTTRVDTIRPSVALAPECVQFHRGPTTNTNMCKSDECSARELLLCASRKAAPPPTPPPACQYPIFRRLVFFSGGPSHVAATSLPTPARLRPHCVVFATVPKIVSRHVGPPRKSAVFSGMAPGRPAK